MFVSLILILIVTVGGLSLTYLFSEDEPLMWRLCAGNVVGQTIFGLVCFVAACFFGLTTATVLIALLITALPLILFGQKNIKQNLSADWLAAKQSLEGANFGKILRFSYCAAFLILFYFFFDRTMFEMKGAIYTGGSNNFGDLPFHLGTIFSFTDGQNFPPQNPSYADVKFTYPFIADLVAASFVKIGASVRDAMLVQNVTLAFSLLVILERFTFKVTNNRLAGKIAPVLLFFCGGLGFLWFFKDASQTAKSFYEFMWNLPRDYTISENFRFGNSLNTLFGTQRSLLLGMPLTIIILQKIWQIFNAGMQKREYAKEELENVEPNSKSFSIFNFQFSIFLVGLLAGTLPLVHLHSLVCLFVVSAILFFFSAENWREWVSFGVGVAVIAVPELVWALTGSATHTDKFIEWFFGWDVRDLNFFWFWLKNTGIFIPVLFFGLYLAYFSHRREDEKQRTKNKEQRTNLLIFYIPFAALFIISNIAKLAPWEWDNIKVLIYWFVGSIPFAAFALAWLWEKNKVFKLIAAGCLLTLTFAGALDVWRQISGVINYEIFRADAVKSAEQIKQKTPPNALFLNAPTYNSAVVLSGRRSLMRYTGHLASHGIDFGEREDDLKRIYSDDITTDALLKKYGIEYILISPEERSYFQTNNVPFNESYLQKFPVVAEAGQYKVYQVK
ncbi:MAG: hypothetical protein ABI891_04040 [Acidobacteriota bacterium]